MTNAVINHLALIGIGLIGSSIALAARKYNLVEKISISSRSEITLKEAEQLNLGDHYTLDTTECVKDADLVILCTPVGTCETITKVIAPHLKAGAIVSDVGSVKQSVVDQMKPHLPDDIHFIPAHPLAGTEYSGPSAGFSSLFQNRWLILTPLEGTNPTALKSLTTFWKQCGANVEYMTPQHHDEVLAITSHLPHLIAYNIVGTITDLEGITEKEIIKYSAAGFRDFTRIAASDPTMWRDVFLHNKSSVLEMLGRFTEDLLALQKAIRWADGETLFDLFTRTRSVRQSIIEAGQETSAPDFGRLTSESDTDKQ